MVSPGFELTLGDNPFEVSCILDVCTYMHFSPHIVSSSYTHVVTPLVSVHAFLTARSYSAYEQLGTNLHDRLESTINPGSCSILTECQFPPGGEGGKGLD